MEHLQHSFSNKKTLNDKKLLYKFYDIWSSELLEESVIFFGLTINCCSFFTDKTHQNDINSFEDCIENSNFILNLLSEIEFIECIVGSYEIGKSKIVHLHSVIGFRSHFNCTQFIQNRIESNLAFRGIGDYKLSFLRKFKDVTNSLRYLSKDFPLERPYNYAFIGIYSSFFKQIHDDMATMVVENRIKFIGEKTQYGFFAAYNNDIPFGKFSEIKSISKNLKEKEVFELVFYINFYIRKKKLLFYKDFIYEKKQDYLISYVYLDSFDNFISKNFLSIILYLKENFFDFINTMRFSALFSEHIDKIIKQLKTLLNTSKKELCFDLLEFKDGIYVATNDHFFKKSTYSNLDLLENNYFTTRSYNVTYYHSVYKKTNKFLWKDKLNINLTNEKFLNFCYAFRNVVFTSLESDKKNIMFLLGVSNSGKSRLVLDIALNSYGQECVGSLSSDSKFLFENLIKKQLAIIDEPDLSKSTLNMIKKLGSGEIMTINSKYQKAFFGSLTTKIIGASNYNQETNFFIENDAVLARMLLFYFDNTCSLDDKEHKQILSEIPQILLFCNKEYLKKKKKNNALFLSIKKLLKE